MSEGKLIFKDGSTFSGKFFGAEKSITGEIVFATGMTGYIEALTDPSFIGQILVLTYPIIGNYGVPIRENWESSKIQVAGLIVSNYIDTPSHYNSKMTLANWLKEENIPALEIKDTRALAIKIRTKGAMLGGIHTKGFAKELTTNSAPQDDLQDYLQDDPNFRNLVAEVSTNEIKIINPDRGKIKGVIVLIDCGLKQNIARCLIKRNFRVVIVPWDTDVTKLKFKIDAVVISNGPGDPMKVRETIENVKKIMDKKIPILGICLGHQILALAAKGKTYKLKFGHRSQNQPCVLSSSTLGRSKCYLTTQNHGFAVKTIPDEFKEWFYNANDNTNEGIIHKNHPWMSVQFHPEGSPGPMDTEWIFDYFLRSLV